jgi:hypothetical protein
MEFKNYIYMNIVNPHTGAKDKNLVKIDFNMVYITPQKSCTASFGLICERNPNRKKTTEELA